jgi:phosphatidylglycerol lysyltransferase
VPERLERLAGVVPLVELSHFVASLVGSALLLLAFGLYRRLDSAWWLALGATVAGIVASLLKGLDWEEALLLAALAATLLVSRRRFYRRGSLLAEPFTFGWIAAIATVLATSVWLGLFAYRHVEYSHDLWWQVALDGDAPRFLRATAGAVGLALVFALARLAVGAARRSPPDSEATVEEIAPLVAACPDSMAHLALLGDKRFLLARDRDAFLMYAVERRSWIGPPDARRELAWRFRELVDRHDAWTVFYQVRADDLPLYLDLGLALIKLGEEARVPLADFGLDGAHRKGFRNVLHRLEREGVAFEWLPAGSFAAALPELAALSDAWLTGKATREKGFSIGFFDPAYLSRCPLAVLRQGGRIVAFANVWSAAASEEMSVDLMRHLPDAPSGVMDFLFLRLMLHARERGIRWFNLGMAPLAGLEARRLAPLWHRLGTFAFLHGEHFYNFQGLRQYKAKFDPVWSPRYLASPGGLTLPAVLTHVAACIGGGMRGVLAR